MIRNSFTAAAIAALIAVPGYAAIDKVYDDYQIIVTLGSAPMLSADGTQIVFSTLDEPQAYETLIQKFAEGVVLMLKEY